MCLKQLSESWMHKDVLMGLTLSEIKFSLAKKSDYIFSVCLDLRTYLVKTVITKKWVKEMG